MKHPHIVVESHIPFIRGVFEQAGASVSYIAPEEINAAGVADADALVVRTRTRCDSALLAGSRCRIVASATIGTDHIDLEWCRSAGIEAVNAPGCNAPAVAQYLLASVIEALPGAVESGATLGVVGCGNVGSIVARWGRSIGLNVLQCDPPRAAREGGSGFVTLDEIARCADIITFHTPLTREPLPFATRHMVDSAFLGSLRRKPMIVNSARGAVVDTPALIEACERGLTGPLAIDCWEGEPAIDRRLLEIATIATPHIAGYSRQGKIRASQMAVDAVCRSLGLPPLEVDAPRPAPVPEAVAAAEIAESYSPAADTLRLKNAPDEFERLRNTYDLRREPGQK